MDPLHRSPPCFFNPLLQPAVIPSQNLGIPYLAAWDPLKEDIEVVLALIFFFFFEKEEKNEIHIHLKPWFLRLLVS